MPPPGLGRDRSATDPRARRAWFWRSWSLFMLVFGLYALVLWFITEQDVPEIWWAVVTWGVLPAVAFGLVLWLGRATWRTSRQRVMLGAFFVVGWLVAALARDAAVWWITSALVLGAVTGALRRVRKPS